MSVVRNPGWLHNAGALMLFGFLLGGLSGCDSVEKYQKTAPQVPPPPEQVGGEIRFWGTPEQKDWVKNLAEALDAARLKYDLRDTLGAIASADSLARVTEAALDTLPIGHSLADFLTIYIADAYGTIQIWETARGNHTAVSELSKRYTALAERLQHRRDSVAALEP
jgi:hypothetical protein